MNIALRRFLFGNYWWIVTLAVLCAVPLILYLGRNDPPSTNIASVCAVCAGAMGVVYFVQKQRIEEIQVFERLFAGFNLWYDDLDDTLQDIVRHIDIGEDNFRRTLNRYFNLCAEEYLFYSQGHILPSVWRAWCRGMAFYLEDDRIAQFFALDVRQDSHYGLTIDVIRHYAGSR